SSAASRMPLAPAGWPGDRLRPAARARARALRRTGVTAVDGTTASGGVSAFLRRRGLMLAVIAGLVAGIVFWLTDQTTALAVTAYLVLGVVTLTTAVGMVRDLLAGRWGLDVLAVIA